MFAASSLVVAVLATYASVAVLSLSAAAPSYFGSLPGVQSVDRAMGWSTPKVDSLVKLRRSAPTVNTGALADISLINLGTVRSATAHAQTFSIKNTTSRSLPLHLAVSGAPGVTAQFVANNGSDIKVPAGKSATISVVSDPVYAGTINASLAISVPNSGLAPKVVTISGAQAPLPPGPVTATPATDGAVNLSWTPSLSVSGVAGYIVERSPAGSGAYQAVVSLTPATSVVDHTPADAAYSYQVVAVATGGAAPQSSAGPAVSVTSDSQAPVAPTGVAPLQPFLNHATVQNPLSVTVQLPNSSASSDTITVTLTDANGKQLVQTAPGGGQTAPVQFSSVSQLADGDVSVSATATDSAGNQSTAFKQPSAFAIDTTAPGDPASVTAPARITTDTQQAVPVQVQTVATDAPTDVLHVSLSQAGSPPVTDTFPVSAADQPLSMNAQQLPDGQITISAWVVDEAGNPSNVVQAASPSTKDTTGPTAPTFVGVAAGPNNPVNVVTPDSENAVIVQATFAQAPAAGDQLIFWVAGTSYQVQSDGQSTTYTVDPPIDMSGLSDGTYHVGLKETDADGNATKTFTHFSRDTSGPTAPTSVGVPAGPDNPAGYVNAATQTAVTIVASFAGPTDPADQIALSVGGLALAPQSGGSDQAVFTGDLSSLPDGTLQILGTITDPNGVSTSFSGTLIKDTQAPPAPAAAYVVGPPPNTITNTDASCVKVAVAFNQAPDPSDMVTVTLSDGNTSVQGSAPAGDGQVEIGCIDASSLSAGQIAVNVTVTDAAGNSTSVAGTTATKLDCPQN